MVIWQISASSDYLSLVDASITDLRRRNAYVPGKTRRWHPTYIEYMIWVGEDTDERHERIPNFPRLSSYIVCDEKSKSILKESIHGHAEFLPLRSRTITDRRFYLLQTTTFSGQYVSEGIESVSIRDGVQVSFRQNSFVLDPSIIEDVPIFRLPTQIEIDVFVTDRFKQLIEDNDLKGLVFERRWEI